MVLIRIYGEFGRIGDRILNSSYPTSFIPNISQIVGIINSILGKKAKYYSFSGTRKLLEDIEKDIKINSIYIVKMPKILDFNILRINHDKSKAKKQLTTTIEYQYLYDFEYIIDIEFSDRNLEEIFISNLKDRRIRFTPVLGSSECLIDVGLVDKVDNYLYAIKPLEKPIEKEIIMLYGYKKNYIFYIEKNEL